MRSVVVPVVVAVLALTTGPAGPPAAVAAAAASAPGDAVRDVGSGAAGGFRAPVSGPITVLEPFGAPPTRYGAGHRGVDLAVVPGGPVLAAADGTVAFSGPVAGRPVVSVQHPDGLRTTYEPVVGIVPAGTSVRAGQPIGTVAGAHRTCAADGCLHWGVRTADGTYLDPMALLAGWPVRLWPWDSGAADRGG